MARYPVKTSEFLCAMAQGIELTVREGQPLHPGFAADVVAMMRAVARDLVQPVTVVVPGTLSADTWMVATVSPGGRWKSVSAWSSEREARREARNIRRRCQVRK